MAARREIFKNNSEAVLNEALDASETGVDVVDGSVFPSTGDFRIIIDDEIMLVTARSTNTLTVVRGVEGTTGASHTMGVAVTQILTEDGVFAYIRDSVPYHSTSRQPFRIMDEDGETLDSSDFTAHTLGTSPTVNDHDGAISVIKTSADSDPDWSLFLRPAVSPMTITACMRIFVPQVGGGNVSGIGIGFRESTTSKFVVMGTRGYTLVPGWRYLFSKFTDADTLSADYVDTDSGKYYVDDIWLRVEDNATNLIASISPDGVNWLVFDTRARGNFMAGAGPDQVFWGVNHANGTTMGMIASLLSWQETT